MMRKSSLLGTLGTFAALALPAVAGQPLQAQALSADLAAKVVQSVDADAARLQEIFKDLHQNPELGFLETRTAGIVAKELQALGYEVKTGIGKTGVVGILRNGEGPTVMFRADMDAVPVEDLTGVPYASKVRATLPDGSEVPVGHMCGHDAHTTWLISLAKTMASLKADWSGTLILVAQPAEEPIEGATAMAEDGLFEGHGVPVPDVLLALHTAPLPTGMVVGSGGLLQAGTEQLDVIFHGVGAHGSSPQFAKDPILMGAYAITEYQAILSRVLDPRETGVITVGAFNAGTSNNVIPDQAELKLNFRFFTDEVHQKLFNGVKAIGDGIARTYGMPEDKLPTIVRKGFSSPLVNDVELMDRMNGALLRSGVVNEKTLVTEFEPITGSEDVQMLVHGRENVRLVYDFIGIAPPAAFAKATEEGKEFPYSNHQPTYLVDLDAIPFGAKVAGLMTMELLAR